MKRGLPLCTLIGAFALALGTGVDCSGSGNGSNGGSGGSTSNTGGATSGTLTGATGTANTSSTGSGTTGSSPTATTGTNGNTTTATSGTATTATSGTATTTSTTTTSGTMTGSTTTTATSTSSGGPTSFGTIFTIVLENHDYKEVVGAAAAPYINQLIAQGGLATNYFDSGTHPSLPNYLYLVSGDTQYQGGIDEDPSGTFSQFPVSSDNLGNQMQMATIAWRSYQESAGGTCVLSANNNHYAPKHDPFLYFDDIQSNQALCDKTNVDYGAFTADLAGGTYKYMWITPNLLDDGHDPVDSFGNATDPVASLTTCDTWLSKEVPKILMSQAYQQNGVLFITWDEAEGRNNDDPDQIPMIVLSPRIVSAGYKSATHFTHANYLATVEDMMSLPRLGAAVGVANMMEFFQ